MFEIPLQQNTSNFHEQTKQVARTLEKLCRSEGGRFNTGLLIVYLEFSVLNIYLHSNLNCEPIFPFSLSFWCIPTTSTIIFSWQYPVEKATPQYVCP